MTADTLPRGSDVVLDRDRKAPAGATGEILQVPLELIDVDENIRRNISDERIAELAASIEEHGVLQPISLRDVEGDRFAINFGQSRYLASKLLGRATIPAFVDNTARSPEQLAIHQLLENLHRADLPPLDRARAMQKVVDSGMTQVALAKQLGIGESTVTNDLALLKAPAKVQEAILAGEITPAHAKAIKGLSTADQEELLQEAIDEHLSAHELEEAVQTFKSDAEWRAKQEASNLEAARASAERFEAKLAELVAKVPLDTPIRTSGQTWSDEGKAKLKAIEERLVAHGFSQVKREGSQGRAKGYCDCTAWKVEVGYRGDVSITPACIKSAHGEAKYAADAKRDRAKYELQEKVHNQVKSTATAWAITGGTAAAVGLNPNATAIAIPRLLAESALWGLLGYRLPDWSVAHDGKRNTAWAVIHALSDEDLAKELARELAHDFRDKAGYHIDWAGLDEELAQARAEKPERTERAPDAPAFGQLVVAGDDRYRISKVTLETLHLTPDHRQWRNGEIVAHAHPAQLTWDPEAKAWSGEVTAWTAPAADAEPAPAAQDGPPANWKPISRATPHLGHVVDAGGATFEVTSVTYPGYATEENTVVAMKRLDSDGPEFVLPFSALVETGKKAWRATAIPQRGHSLTRAADIAAVPVEGGPA